MIEALKAKGFAVVAMLSLIFGLGGCDSGPQRARVHGTVTVGGETITQGVVMFYPASGRPATGQIDANGEYELMTYDPGDGAVLGEHSVTIEAIEVQDNVRVPKSLMDEQKIVETQYRQPEVRWLVPEKYSNRTTSPLKVTVENEDNRIDFKLE